MKDLGTNSLKILECVQVLVWDSREGIVGLTLTQHYVFEEKLSLPLRPSSGRFRLAQPFRVTALLRLPHWMLVISQRFLHGRVRLVPIRQLGAPKHRQVNSENEFKCPSSHFIWISLKFKDAMHFVVINRHILTFENNNRTLSVYSEIP